jgi:hypothetical protein
MTANDGAPGDQANQDATEEEPESGQFREDPFQVDLDVAQPVRIRDAVLGGASNFTVDREAAGKVSSALPGGAETAHAMLEANRAFRRRAVRHLVTQTGLRQFLPVGVGIPQGRTSRQIAQELAPDAKFVYCVDDPVALAHAHELQGDSEDDNVAVIHAGLRDTGPILAQAAKTFDLGQPVGLVLTTVTFVPDEEDPWRSTADLLAGLPAGSYLVLSQLASDIGSDNFAPAGRQQRDLTSERRMLPLSARRRADVERFFEGLDLLEPGVVSVDEWHPDADTPFLPDGLTTPFYAAVGRT